jgi:hypothetical protein
MPSTSTCVAITRTANLDKIAAADHTNVGCVLVAGFDVLVRGPRSGGRTS